MQSNFRKLLFIFLINITVFYSVFFYNHHQDLITIPINFIFFLVTSTLIFTLTFFLFFVFNINNQIWRYISKTNLVKITGFNIVLVLVISFSIFMYDRSVDIPRRFYLQYFIFNNLIVIFSILLWKFSSQYSSSDKKNYLKKNVAIIGFNESTDMFYKLNKIFEFYKVKFIFSNNKNIGNKLYFNLRVINNFDSLVQLIETSDLHTIFFSEILSKIQVNKLTDICISHNINLIDIRTMKNMFYLERSTNIDFLNLRNLIPNINIKFDLKNLSFLKNNNIIITGAAGSIGSEIVKQISALNLKTKLILVDTNEEKLMQINLFLAESKNKNFKIYSSDISEKSLSNIFKTEKPDIVFHAAAMKHVPFVESFPFNAIKTNIIGTFNLLSLSKKHKVKLLINISSDKAVNPTNIMGMTKRLNELYIQYYANKYNLNYQSVRFGNVLNSSGSVIPIFDYRLKKNLKIQITHPDIERFFMSIEDAVYLVLITSYLTNISKLSESSVFVLDMGKQIKIIDLAKKYLKIKGYDINKYLDTNFIGLRDGEKLFEELSYNYENLNKSKYPFILKTTNNISKEFNLKLYNQLMSTYSSLNNNQIIEILKNLIHIK
jgi:FlaA1/EpsC-like NDP-sugar epimerase